MLKVGHKYNLYDIAIEFKIVMMAAYHKFHIKFYFITNGFKLILIFIFNYSFIYNVFKFLTIL